MEASKSDQGYTTLDPGSLVSLPQVSDSQPGQCQCIAGNYCLEVGRDRNTCPPRAFHHPALSNLRTYMTAQRSAPHKTPLARWLMTLGVQGSGYSCKEPTPTVTYPSHLKGQKPSSRPGQPVLCYLTFLLPPTIPGTNRGAWIANDYIPGQSAHFPSFVSKQPTSERCIASTRSEPRSPRIDGDTE